MGFLLHHDQLHSSIHFCICRILPDGRLGIGQAQELQDRIQKLSEIAKGHHSVRSVEAKMQITIRSQNRVTNTHCRNGNERYSVINFVISALYLG